MIRALCTRSGLIASASRHTRNVSCSPRATLMMSTCRLSSSTGYPGLILSIATFEDVQGVMHNTPTEQRKYGCPLPCKLPPWEDPRINQKRRESPHATVYPFESEHLSIGHALDTASLGASSRVVMLSGSERAWSFFFSGEIHKRPSVRSAPAANVPFQSPSFNDTSWHRISVPSNWEMVGFGVPLYVNSTR